MTDPTQTKPNQTNTSQKKTSQTAPMYSHREDDPLREKFWELPLNELTPREWEALCDGCARCCLHKLQDEDDDLELYYTRVVCQYLDESTCQCRHYQTRQQLVPDCLVMDPQILEEAVDWMPATCAYKLRYYGKPLASWHPLIAGNRDMMDELDISVTGKVVPDSQVAEDEMEDHIIRWVTQ